MPLQSLIPGSTPAAFDVQETEFSHDVLGRFLCNTWGEIQNALGSGTRPLDAVVIGAGMFGGYVAEKLYRQGTAKGLRILVLDAGPFTLATHIQNLPQRLGGAIGNPPGPRTSDTGTQNVLWGMPWISNTAPPDHTGFPGLAYCVGGRSLFWGGWSPRLTQDDLTNWPTQIRDFLVGTGGNPGQYDAVEQEIGVVPSTDYITQATLFGALTTAFNNARVGLPEIKSVGEAPLAVQGSAPASGVFPFDKFSSAPFLIDAIRNDVAVNNSQGDRSRRLFLLPRTQVLRLNRTGNQVTSLDLLVNGQAQPLTIPPSCAVILANGTVEATRLALGSLGVGNTQFGSPRVGNLMAHLRSNITVRVNRTALGLPTPAVDLETTALLVRGSAQGRRFHLQVTAAAVAGTDPEKNLWSMVPDIDQFHNLLTQQNPNKVVITLRGIGEMEDQRSLTPDPARSWIDLSNETDGQTRRAFVNLVPTANDRLLWAAMDKATFDLATNLVTNPADIEYLTGNGFVSQRPQPDANGRGFWQDKLGTTHHEAGTLFMGAAGQSITDLNGKFHAINNAYVVGPAVFPTLGSANPSLTALSLAQGTAAQIVTLAP
jgi:choline dehydrogenase-like flavoprotein